MKEVIVYSKPNCTYCEEAKEVLKSRGIQYRVIDVSRDMDALQKLKDAGFRSVPQLYVDGEHIGDSQSARTLEV